MLKILQARFQQYVSWERPDVQAGFRKGRGTRDQIANICWIIEKARKFQKNIYFCFIDYTKAFVWITKNWKTEEMRIPDHFTGFLRNLYAGQEATVRTGHGTTGWFRIGKGVYQGCILSLCLFNFHAETSCESPGWMKHKLESRLLGEISITSDTQMIPPLWQKSKEELKSLLKVKEESEKDGLKLSIQKTKIKASSLIISWQIDGETIETVTDFICLGPKVTVDGHYSHEIKRRLFLGRKAMTNLVKVKVAHSCLTLWPYELLPSRLLCPWGFSRHEY